MCNPKGVIRSAERVRYEETGMCPAQLWVPLEMVTAKSQSDGPGGSVQVTGRRQYSREEPDMVMVGGR